MSKSSQYKNLVAAALLMAGCEAGYDVMFGEFESRRAAESKPYSTDGRKCGQCTKFGTTRCRCKLATESSPACSAMTIKR